MGINHPGSRILGSNTYLSKKLHKNPKIRKNWVEKTWVRQVLAPPIIMINITNSVLIAIFLHYLITEKEFQPNSKKITCGPMDISRWHANLSGFISIIFLLLWFDVIF